MKTSRFAAIAAYLAIALSSGSLFGRGFGGGFGGFHGGGGFAGGGFHGGSLGGGFGGGGFQRPQTGSGFGSGGFAPGGMSNFHGFGAGGFGGGYTQRIGGGGPGAFAGGGTAGLSAFDRGLDAMRRPSAGGEFGGAGARGGELGGLGNLADVRPSAGQLGSFLGLPSDIGVHAAGRAEPAFGYAGNARGLSAFTPAARPSETGERAAVARPDAAAAAARPGIAGRGAVTRNWSAGDLRVQGNNVRANFNRYDAFNRNWFHDHPAAWWASGFRHGFWHGANWAEVNDWFGDDWPIYGYDYGNDITYQNNNVYLYDQPIATADQYYQSAAALVQSGAQAQIPSEPPNPNAQPDAANAKWLPLGVFQAIPPGEKSSKMLLQLAVNKEGILRGNYYNTGDENVRPIEGAVDKSTARAAWVVADKKDIVFDSGLYNLTKDETAILVHFAKDKTEQWTLVRMKQQPGSSTNP